MDINVKRLPAAVLALSAACALAACGGGGGATSSLPAASAPAVQQPASAPGFRVTQTVAAGTAGPANLPPLQSGGYGVALALPAADSASSDSVTLSEAFTNQAPADAPSLQSALRSTRGTGTTSPFMLSYVEIVAGGTLSFKSSPSFSFVAPSWALLPNYAYYLALLDDDKKTWQLAFEGPATISGNTLNFAPSPSALRLSNQKKYVFAVYGLPAASVPAPTPAPTPSAPPVTVAPAATSLVVGPGSTLTSATITASQPGNNGPLNASLACAVAHGAPGNSTVATVSPASASPATPGASVSFTVTAVTGGTCTLTVGNAGGSGTATVSVFQAVATIQ